MKIALVVPNRQNLRYFKWSYDSIRKNQGNHEVWICSASDACTDGTLEYYEELAKRDPYFKYIVNEGPERVGHTILYDRIINEIVPTEIAMIWHCDMYLCPGALDAIDKYMNDKTIVSLTRIEPPLHPPGVEKLTFNFGQEPEEFIESNFLFWFNNSPVIHNYKNITTEGVFAPWAFYVKDFQEIGGHDKLYAPQSKEDSDIFNRFKLNGISFIQTWEGYVYHMTCRGSRYNPTLTQVGVESKEWLAQNERATRNFIRKWGHFVKHDAFMNPIIPHKYDIGIVVKNCTSQILRDFEPWCSTIYIDDDMQIITMDYIEKEQPNTLFYLKNRICPIGWENLFNDIIVTMDAQKIDKDDYSYIYNLSDILGGNENLEPGKFQLGNLLIEIRQIKTYEKSLIKIINNLDDGED